MIDEKFELIHKMLKSYPYPPKDHVALASTYCKSKIVIDAPVEAIARACKLLPSMVGPYAPDLKTVNEAIYAEVKKIPADINGLWAQLNDWRENGRYPSDIVVVYAYDFMVSKRITWEDRAVFEKIVEELREYERARSKTNKSNDR